MDLVRVLFQNKLFYFSKQTVGVSDLYCVKHASQWTSSLQSRRNLHIVLAAVAVQLLFHFVIQYLG